jgi:hypothetical protein
MPVRRTRPFLALLAAGLLALPPATAVADRPGGGGTLGPLLYPDLITLPPSDLRFETVSIDAVATPVLRFSNTVANVGQGTLRLEAKNDRRTRKTQVFQRLYDANGNSTTVHAGTFEFHLGHNHFHFGDFAKYELWDEAAWEARTTTPGQAALRTGSKTTFCIMDTDHLYPATAGSPSNAVYTSCNPDVQGMSVGWGDRYGAHLSGQWVALPPEGLGVGRRYVLRSIADPLDRLDEGDAAREANEANEAITRFVVQLDANGNRTPVPDAH